jgi:hypothetical protein
MKCGNGNAAACRDFAYSQFTMKTGWVSLRFHFVLDLKLT